MLPSSQAFLPFGSFAPTPDSRYRIRDRCRPSFPMDRPHVEVGGPEITQAAEISQAPSNNEVPDVVMGSTHNTDTPKDGHSESTPDVPLPVEEPAPVKKKPGLQFLE